MDINLSTSSFFLLLESLPFSDLGTITILFLTIGILVLYLRKLVISLVKKMASHQLYEFYQQIIKPESNWLTILGILSVFDIITLIVNQSRWLNFVEILVGLTIVILGIILTFRWCDRLFEYYLLDRALKKQEKINSEFLIIGKYVTNSIVAVILIFVFAQVHNVNIFGLLASLGIGGLAVAFAAQKTLEQLLGGIVIYIDRPFVQDDYIGLPDGTFGQVESIGLRSTKIRTSGKGTLMIIPNSSLTQTNIENFSGAKKQISLVYLNFDQKLPEEEKALINQIILQSTKDIVGLDSRSNNINFKDVYQGNKTVTQAQISFFILGSGNVSMDLRKQLLNIANDNISKQLKEYGISFDLEDKNIDVNSPITI